MRGRTTLWLFCVSLLLALAAFACERKTVSEHGAASAAQPARPPERDTTKMYKKPSDDELRQKLSPLEYEVTQRAATEPPFSNRYWDNHDDGLYVDVATGEPLFSSRDKFESGTGWPSFYQPISKRNIAQSTDRSLIEERTEVKCARCDAHLGHVFDDGPDPTGLRYCMNAVAMTFVAYAA